MTKKRAYMIESTTIAQYSELLGDFDVSVVVVSDVAAVFDVALLVSGDPLHVPPGQHPASHPY
jgi:hypothetical protein